MRAFLFAFLAACLPLGQGCQTLAADTQGVPTMQVHFLEIVTKDVDGVCAVYAATHGVEFRQPEAKLGNARTAAMPDGGIVSVRAPLRPTEEPVVRPYWLVDDIEAAVAAAKKAGGMIAHPPLLIPEMGTFAIYIHGGVEHGLWERLSDDSR